MLDKIRLECSEKHKYSNNTETRFLLCLWLLGQELGDLLGCLGAH